MQPVAINGGKERGMKIELNKHDRICCLGASIFQNGQWIAEVFEYFKEHFPELEIGFYNCGIAGTTSWHALSKDRLYADCLHLAPKYVVFGFGMNDIGRHLYVSDDAKMLIQRQERIDQFKDAMTELLEACKQAGAVPILCSVTPYDEYNEPDAETTVGLDKGSEKLANEIEKMAAENNLLFIDMRKILMKYMDRKPIGRDRVHPNKLGQHLMAECFLCAIGAKEQEEPDKVIELQGKSEARFQTEQKLRRIMFVERQLMGWQNKDEVYTLAERKDLVRQRLEKEEAEWIKGLLRDYLDSGDFKEELRGELVRQTIQMYVPSAK